MKKLLFLLCAGSLAFLPTGCGQESLSGLEDMGQVGVESSSEGDVGSSSSGNLSSSSVTPKLSSSETSVSSSSKKNTSGISHSYGKLLDKRDSTVYKTVTIGGLTWMAENLDYETDYSYCFADLPENCQKYGRLYLWGTAMDSVGEFSNNAKGCGFHSSCKAVEPVRGICPEGWHLPSLKEMTVLFTSAGGRSIAGRVLKSTYDWTLDGNGEDLLGFSVLPAGLRSYENEYINIGSFSYFWTTDRRNSDFTDIANFQYDSDGAGRISYTKKGAFPVRCVQDYPTKEPDEISSSSGRDVDYGEFTDSRDDQTYKTVVVGEKVWMAQNLNYECKKSYCYDNSYENCDKYGRFYDWSMAQEICPKGWHLPDTAEWNALFDYVGGKEYAATKLKALSAWRKGIHGKDICGFAALPGGRRDSSGAFIDGVTDYTAPVEYAHFWASEEFLTDYGYSVYMASDLEYAGFTFYYKNDYRSVRCVRDEPASSSSEKVSSSSEKVSSSSVKSSSSVSPTSSSGKTVNTTFLWDGTIDTEGQVETGSPDETAGYWYDFSDRDVGGSSKFIFPSDVEEREDGNFYGPLVEYYMGIRASVSFGDDYDPPYQPYAGIGFNVWSVDQEGVDVSAWGGICLTFQSTIAFSIELGIEDEATITAYEKYRASVPESKSVTTIDFPWSKFKTGVWGPSASIEDVLKKVAAIKLKFEGSAGTTGEFLIQKIGSLGQCGGLGLL